MKILLIECDAEELRTNRTIFNGITEAISSFTRSFAGVDITKGDLAAFLANLEDVQEEEEVEGGAD